jgi:hypothetical protein
MVMVLEASDHFLVEAKAASDQTNPKMREWVDLMRNYQKAFPQARLGEKWIQMERSLKRPKLSTPRREHRLCDGCVDARDRPICR